MAKLETDIPIYYLFEDRGKWTKTDTRLTKEINNHVFRHKGRFNTAGHAFYPQWPEPEFKSKVKAAWMVDKQGFQVARTGFVQRDHDKNHRFCQPCGNGECRIQVIRRLEWNIKARMWTLIPLEDEQGANSNQ